MTSKTRRERHRKRHLGVRVAVAVAGFGALLGGIAMLVLPGPGFAAIAVGLGLLALEFEWAERMLGRVLRRVETVTPSRRGPRIAFWVATGVLALTGLVLSALYLS